MTENHETESREANTDPRPDRERRAAKRRRKRPRRRRWLRVAGGLTLLCCLVVLFAPWVVANSGLRNRVLNWVLSSDQLAIEAQGAELGWLSPVLLERVVVTDQQDDFRLSVPEIAFESPWLELWSRSPDLGEVSMTEPHLEMRIPRLTPRQVPGDTTPVTMDARVEDASIRLRAREGSQPILEVDDLDLEFRVEQTPDARLLHVEPMEVLDHYPVTEEVCREGLQLVAPILADVSRAEGKVSLRLDTFRMPLDEVEPEKRHKLVDIEGQLGLHQVSTGFRNPLLREITSVLTGLFGFEIPSEVRLVDDSEVDFHVRDGRIHHRSLSFLLPGISGGRPWESSGSVGLDESLDLTIDAPLPVEQLPDNRLTRRLSRQRMTLHVGGTIENPEITLPEKPGTLWELAEAIIPGDDEQRPSSDSAVDQVLDRAAIVLQGAEAASDLFRMIRDSLHERDGAPSDSEDPATEEGSKNASEDQRTGTARRGIFRRSRRDRRR